MTCFSCYTPLSDLSRKDGGENVGGEQSSVGGWGDPARKHSSLPFSGLSIALSLLIRKLMQLSVLILESSFYSFFSLLLCNLFLFCSALICAVAADDKTGHIRLLAALFFFYKLCGGSSRTLVCFNNFAAESEREEKKEKSFPGEFSCRVSVILQRFSVDIALQKPERKLGLLCFKHKEAPVLRPLKCTKCWSLLRYCSRGERMNFRVKLNLQA